MKIINKAYLEKTFPLEHVKFAFSLKHIAKGHKYTVRVYLTLNRKEERINLKKTWCCQYQT